MTWRKEMPLFAPRVDRVRRRWLLAALLLGPAAAPARADDEWSPEPKVVLVDLARPNAMDSNARLWFSLNQALGEGSRRLGESGADRRWWGRSAQFVSLAYLNLAIGHYTHELGHNVHARGWSLDLADWSQWPWPRWIHGRCDPGFCGNADDHIRDTSGGLDAEEQGAYFLYRRSMSSMSFDEFMAFAFRRFSALTYETYSAGGDVTSYRRQLRIKGIELSEREYHFQAALSDVLTFRLWEGFAAQWAYLRHGVRETPTRAVRVAGWDVYPPLVSFFLTPEGTFYDLTILGRRSGFPEAELHLGRDADFLGGGKVTRLRFGGEVSWRFGRRELSPFAYLDLRRSPLRTQGYHAGVRAQAPLLGRLRLTGRVEYSSDDVVENAVKWEPEGFGAMLGLAWRFPRSGRQ